MKVKRSINAKVGEEAFEVDCHNHLGKAPTKVISKHLSALMKDSLEEIDSSLRVSSSFMAFAWAFDKMFSTSCNYVKGDGEKWVQYLCGESPGILLYDVENTHGARQDVVFAASIAIYLNREPFVSYLEMMIENSQTFCVKICTCCYPVMR